MPSLKRNILRIKARYRDGFLYSSPACTVNTLLNQAERGMQRTAIRSYPRILQVDLTNRCNLNCIFCLRHIHRLKLGDLPEGLIPAIERASERSLETILTGYGEPLISETFFTLLGRVRSSRISFITNGLTLTETVLERILTCARRPIYNITVSIDGVHPETYNFIRKRSDFDRVWSNLVNLAKVGRKSNVPFETWINFVAMKTNVMELPELIRRASEIGISRIIVFHLVVWHEDYYDESLLLHPDLNREAFIEAQRVASQCGVCVDLPVVFNQNPAESPGRNVHQRSFPRCNQPWSYAYVRHDGSVYACCYSDAFMMGNLHETSFDEIWNGRLYKNFRRIVNQRLPEDCLRCEMRFRYSHSPDDSKIYPKFRPRIM